MKTFKQYIAESEEEMEAEEEIHYPTGVYIALEMVEESMIAVKEYMEEYLPDIEFNDEQHCTLIYSKKPYVDEIIPGEYQATSTFDRFSKFGENEDVLVVEINSEAILDRNKALVGEYDFISDYDEYKPHFTLSYDAKDIDVNSLPAIDFAIHFDNETVAPLDEDWGDSDDEERTEGEETLVGKALKTLKSKEEKNDADNKKEAKKLEKEAKADKKEE